MSVESTTSTSDQFHLTTEQQGLFNRAMMILLGVGIGWLLFADKEGYVTNVFTEILGAAGTFFVLDYWVRRRDERQKLEEQKSDLISQMGSKINDEAIRAVEELRRRGWLQDGSLLGAYLPGANLVSANLAAQRVEVRKRLGQEKEIIVTRPVQINNANLFKANLSNTQMNGIDLSETWLFDANLQNSSLIAANLQETRLILADLRGCDLSEANLKNTNLFAAKFDETTTFPDGTKFNPTMDVDSYLAKFGAIFVSYYEDKHPYGHYRKRDE